jgi:hypothetical protein
MTSEPRRRHHRDFLRAALRLGMDMCLWAAPVFGYFDASLLRHGPSAAQDQDNAERPAEPGGELSSAERRLWNELVRRLS